MATFFGEVLHDSSRAVDEDEEEDESVEILYYRALWSPGVQAEMLKYPGNKLPCETLLIAVGAAASGFVQSYVLNDQYDIIGSLFIGTKEGEINTLTQTDKTCIVYRSQKYPKVLVCQCNTEVAPEQSYSWVSQLFSAVSTDSVYVSILTTYTSSEFRSEIPVSEMEVPFLRALKTTKFPGTPLCPYLEQPNIVSGLPAQVLTHCEMIGAKAVMYICYTDMIFLDFVTMRTFLPLLKSTPFKQFVEENANAEVTLKEIVDQHSDRNSLYL